MSTPTTRTNTKTTTTTQSHYEQHTSDNTYEEAFFYNPNNEDYIKFLCQIMKEPILSFKNNSNNNMSSPLRILDVGGGTGGFVKQLMKYYHPSISMEALVVDPFLHADDDDDDDTTDPPQQENLRFVSASADIFIPGNDKRIDTSEQDLHSLFQEDPFDLVLLKEVVHHLQDRALIFRGLSQRMMKPASSLVILTRPQTNIDYPLWDAARDVWKVNQPSHEEIENELKCASFFDNNNNTIETRVHEFPCRMKWTQWKSMVQGRCWSTFANFSNDELKAACEDMETEFYKNGRITQDGFITFQDRLISITARKSA